MMSFRSYTDADVGALIDAVVEHRPGISGLSRNMPDSVARLAEAERGRRGCFAGLYTSYVDAVALSGGYEGYTPMQIAAMLGHSDTIEALYYAGAKIDAPVLSGGYKGWTPLHIAAAHGRASAVKILLSAEASPFSRTPLFKPEDEVWRLRPDKKNIFEFVEKIGGDLTPLMLAVAGGNLEVVKAFVRDQGGRSWPWVEDVFNIENSHHLKAALLAARLGYADIVREILDCGKAWIFKDIALLNTLYENILMYAAESDDKELLFRINQVLYFNANLNIIFPVEDDDSVSAAGDVIHRNPPSWNCNTVDATGRTALSRAVCAGNESAVRLLLNLWDDKSVGVEKVRNCLNSGSESFLLLAAQYGHDHLIPIILGHRSTTKERQLKLCNAKGETALFHAARHGHAEVVTALLAEGASPVLSIERDGRAETLNLFKFAIDNGHPQVVATVLRSKDAKLAAAQRMLAATFNTKYTTPGSCCFGASEYSLLDLVLALRDAHTDGSGGRTTYDEIVTALQTAGASPLSHPVETKVSNPLRGVAATSGVAVSTLASAPAAPTPFATVGGIGGARTKVGFGPHVATSASNPLAVRVAAATPV